MEIAHSGFTQLACTLALHPTLLLIHFEYKLTIITLINLTLTISLYFLIIISSSPYFREFCLPVVLFLAEKLCL